MTLAGTAFVGDIHGNIAALRGILELLDQIDGIDRIVFLGDYINKGKNSVAVVQTLLEKSTGERITVLRGNHETEMLKALETGDLASFLKMGGASTIRSYVKRDVGPDVISDFRARVPTEHINFLRSMPQVYETQYVVASHYPAATDKTRFQISAHIPVGNLPKVGVNFAHIDTGCGSPEGRLTAFAWPGLDYVQVDSDGHPIGSDT